MRAIWIAGLIVAALPLATGPAQAGRYDRARSVRVQADAQTSAPAGNAENGKKLWVSYGCYQCHGYEAQGGSAGPRLASRPLTFTRFSTYVRRPTNQMPPYTTRTVPDSDLAHSYAYVQSRPAPPSVAGIPLLQK